MQSSDLKNINMKLLDPTLNIYANPMMLAFNMKIKRAEAGQWFQEVQKLLNGFMKSFNSIEAMMNRYHSKKPIKIDEKEIHLTSEQLYENITYMLDNALLRLFACLDKIAQLIRVYLEHPANGGPLTTKICWKCSHPECKNVEMNEANCSFTSLYSFLKGNKRELLVVDGLLKLYETDSIKNLRPYRNGFAHRKNVLDQSVGLAPDVKVVSNMDEGTYTGTITFPSLPEYNWFRIELANSYNSIINFLNESSKSIFPKDFKVELKKHENKNDSKNR